MEPHVQEKPKSQSDPTGALNAHKNQSPAHEEANGDGALFSRTDRRRPSQPELVAVTEEYEKLKAQVV